MGQSRLANGLAGRVRITAQLIDAIAGTHLWADRFDGSLEEVFELQDRVAFSVAGVLESTLQAAEIKRSTDRPTLDLTAYDLYLQAYQTATLGTSSASKRRSISLKRQSSATRILARPSR
jgi:adenylate cyclase